MTDIRDFIDGTQAQKDQFASMVVSSAFAFSAQLVILFHQYADSMPDGMREDVEALLKSFHGYASEFIDFDALEEFMRGELERDE
jgi:hypothetical protein